MSNIIINIITSDKDLKLNAQPKNGQCNLFIIQNTIKRHINNIGTIILYKHIVYNYLYFLKLIVLYII